MVDSNKLPLNIKNTIYLFFHKRTKRTESIKFLGVLLDETLTWKLNIKYIEKKIAKKYWLIS